MDASDVFDHPSASDRAVDIINWLVDQYYYSSFLDPTGTPELVDDFQYALWELEVDFQGDPTVVGIPLADQLDLTSGSHQRYSGNGYPDANDVIDPLVGRDRSGPVPVVDPSVALYNNITPGYRSTQYEVNFLKDSNSGYQDMLLITPVPEPASPGLALVAGVLFLARRRR